MPIPPALADYKNEAHLTQDFLIPLFIRLGFLSVLNYHGSREYGKDLVIFEYDKLGNAIYHGVRTKHVPSVPMSSVEELVQEIEVLLHTIRDPSTRESIRAKDVAMCMHLIEIAQNASTAVLEELKRIAAQANVSLDSEVQPFLPIILHEGGMVDSHAFAPKNEESHPNPD